MIAHCYSAGYGLDDRGFESRQGLGIFLFTTAYRPALEPIQPPIQWVPGALSRGVKRPRREADHSPLSRTEVKLRGAIPPLLQYAFLACLDAVVKRKIPSSHREPNTDHPII
jgi:hypothetical protein